MCPSHEICNDYARALIRLKAKKVCRRPGFCRSDTTDVEQELFVHLIKQAPNFDPGRSALNTFINKVVDSAAAMIIRQRGRCKRSPGEGSKLESLQMIVDTGDGRCAALGTVITLEDGDRKSRKVSQSQAELLELADEVGTALAQLPEHLQEICRSLMQSSRADTMRNLGIPRRRLNAAIIEIRDQVRNLDSQKS